MKTKLLLLLAILGGAYQLSNAQSFINSPNDTAQAFINPNEFFGMYIYQRNISGSNIQLEWTKISESIPAGWDYSLCDLGTCYSAFPGSGSMAVVSATDSGFISPHCNAFNIPGTLTVRFYVYDAAQPTQGDTLTFIYTLQSTGIETQASSEFTIYPNPSSDFIQLKGGNMELPANLTIFDMNGKVMVNRNLVNETDNINITTLPVGSYVLEIQNKSTIRKTFIKK